MTKRFITSGKINNLTALSKLPIADDEMDKCFQPRSNALDYDSQLEDVDTGNIEPLLNVLDQFNDSRLDEHQLTIIEKLALENAPKVSNVFFQIPEVINKNG